MDATGTPAHSFTNLVRIMCLNDPIKNVKTVFERLGTIYEGIEMAFSAKKVDGDIVIHGNYPTGFEERNLEENKRTMPIVHWKYVSTSHDLFRISVSTRFCRHERWNFKRKKWMDICFTTEILGQGAKTGSWKKTNVHLTSTFLQKTLSNKKYQDTMEQQSA